MDSAEGARFSYDGSFTSGGDEAVFNRDTEISGLGLGDLWGDFGFYCLWVCLEGLAG